MHNQRQQRVTTTLWRPAGEEELALVRDAEWKRWPPRLSGQPIFYPVGTYEYAVQIAREWTATDGQAGFVTEFEVETEWLNRYDSHAVGDAQHKEYWIPAEDLESFNDHIVGEIRVDRAFLGYPPVDIDPPSMALVKVGLIPSLTDRGRQLPETICCAAMRSSLTQTCTLHVDEYDCPDIGVVYRADEKRFGMPVHDGGRSMIAVRFCPWCGQEVGLRDDGDGARLDGPAEYD